MAKKKEVSKEKLSWKKIILAPIIILGIILIFTLIDFFIHKLSNEYSVPSYYFSNKIIFGTLIGFGAYLVFRKLSLFYKTLTFSATISILLQIRYYLEGYPKDFVFLFLGIHFAILLAISMPTFRLAKTYI